MKNLILLVVFVLSCSVSFGQNTWTLIKSQDGVNIYQKTSHCTYNMGFDQERIILKYENTTANKVSVIWDFEIHIDGVCRTCNDPGGEYHKVLELEANESKEGACARETDPRLFVFSKFDDPDNTTVNEELTNFEFANLSVVRMN